MSKSFTSNYWRFGAASWQLAQTFWVGGLWLLHFVLLPALGQIGLASLLIEDVGNQLKPLLVGFAVLCALWQSSFLLGANGLVGFWQDRRGQILLAVLALGGIYFMTSRWAAQFAWGLQFIYLLLAFCGVLLVVQPVPDGEAIRARRARH